MFFIDLIKGRHSLAKTFWLWGVLGNILVRLGGVAAFSIAGDFLPDQTIYDNIINGYFVFSIFWTVLISIAVVSSAISNKGNFFWRFVACIFAVIWVFKGIYSAVGALVPLPITWQSFEEEITLGNSGLPVKLGNNTTLVSRLPRKLDRSLTYYYQVEYNTFQNFDDEARGKFRSLFLKKCDSWKLFLGPTVNIVRLHFTAADYSNLEMDIAAEDCGFKRIHPLYVSKNAPAEDSKKRNHRDVKVLLDNISQNPFSRTEPDEASDIEAGIKAFNKGDYESAITQWIFLADEGYTSAQYNIGIMYTHIGGDTEDYDEGMKWFLMAAKEGHPEAQFELGALYDSGKGIARNHVIAMEWYLKAARQGLSKAAYVIGEKFFLGLGVEENVVSALMWFDIANALGSDEITPSGINKIATPKEKAESKILFREWMDKHQ
jgi:hypothetical protein